MDSLAAARTAAGGDLGIGTGGAAPGLAGDAGDDLEGAGDFTEGYFRGFAVAKAIENALDGVEKFLGGKPLGLPAFIGAADPFSGHLAAGFNLGLGLLFEEAGVERIEAVGPVVTTGPVPNGVTLLIQLSGNGLMRTPLAELKEGREGGVGARGLAGIEGEGGLRLNGRELVLAGDGGGFG